MLCTSSTRRQLVLSIFGTACALASRDSEAAGPVVLKRVPDAGLQPQIVVDPSGAAHLLYFRGEPLAGDLYYAKSVNGGESYLRPIRVNRHPGSAVATGSVRGGHLAIGKNGRVHVAWNGSKDAQPKGLAGEPPMLYTRLDDTGTAFEAERNAIHTSFGLDGGGTVAADKAGNVYIAWHAPPPGAKGEERRQMWFARSTDEGKTFAAEESATDRKTGACGCCGMAAFADARGNVYALYRSAFENVHRDMYLLRSKDKGRTFEASELDPWEVGACVMSTSAFAEAGDSVLAAWETRGQACFARIDARSGTILQSVTAPGPGNGRKHPALAVNRDGDILFAWTEGTGWKRGGSLAWQVYDRSGRPKGDPGHAPGVQAFSFVAAYARPDGVFTVVY